jgi:formylglycine-generating enzyme required for sulfatase activity
MALGGAAAGDTHFPAATGASFRDCPDCPDMVALPTGQFLMGSPATEKYRFDNEGPQHAVRVDKPFAMSKYPVTVQQLAEWQGMQVSADEGAYPAVMVSWFDANAFADWLSKKAGHKYRLPTEAEYEYAERAGTTTPYYWGNDIGPGNANCIGCGSPLDGTGSTKVGSFPPNAWGLYDMAGNVFEWVADCYFDAQIGAPIEASVARQSQSGECPMRVLRASSWYNLPVFLRASYRFREVPSTKNLRRGFRLVREADENR